MYYQQQRIQEVTSQTFPHLCYLMAVNQYAYICMIGWHWYNFHQYMCGVGCLWHFHDESIPNYMFYWHYRHYWPFVKAIHQSLLASPNKGPVMFSFDIFFDDTLIKLFVKTLISLWFQMAWCSCEVTIICDVSVILFPVLAIVCQSLSL